MALITDDVHYQPYIPCFSARKTSTGWTTLSASSTRVPIILDNAYINRGSHYNTSNYRFTAPRPGLYQFNMVAYARLSGDYLDNDTDYYNFYLEKNGSGSTTGAYSIAGYYNDGDYDMSTAMSTVMELASNDYVQCTISSAGVGVMYYGYHCRFSGFFIG